jgi:hypothetical protein
MEEEENVPRRLAGLRREDEETLIRISPIGCLCARFDA